jgi:flagellar hook assembly protein FlgD
MMLPATGSNGQSTPVATFLNLSPFASGSGATVASNSGGGLSVGEDLKFGMTQSSPNPAIAKEGTLIQFALPSARSVSLEVYDVTGRLVRTLVDGPLAAGSHAIQWDGRSKAGQLLPGGVYLYRIRSGADQVEKKLVLID